jgi:hypothetical protein
MRAPRRVVTAFPFLFAIASCSQASQDEPLRVNVGTTLLFPKALLDGVTDLSLVVYDQSAGAGCDPATGRATGTDGIERVASATLREEGCPAGVRFCINKLPIRKDPGTRVFAAVAHAAGGVEVADGCTTAVVNQDSLDIAIKMVRFVPPDVCGDNVIGPTEQCEPAGSATDIVCDAKCHTRELLLSSPYGLATTPNNRVAYAPMLWWPSQGPFSAFFTVKAGATTQVALHVLNESLGKLASPPGISDNAFLVPKDTTFPPQASPNNQSQPSATSIGGTRYVAFTDDNEGTPDIHLRSFDNSYAGQEGPNPIGINGEPAGSPKTPLTGEAGVQEAPSIAAGPGGVLFIAWQDTSGGNQGKVLGRTFTPGSPGVLGTTNEISTASQNKNVKVVATSTGWIAVWESGADVKLRVLGVNGNPSGGELTVNDTAIHKGTQDHPSVAVLGDGRIAVAWADRGSNGGADVFVQRYDKDLVKVAGDQAVRINAIAVDGDQLAPSIAASTAAGGSFVVAWLDAPNKAIRARLLGGTGGFLFNNVDGQNTDFLVSSAAARTRANPVAVAGGTGFLAIAWDDQTPDTTAGTYVRRFPGPTQ